VHQGGPILKDHQAQLDIVRSLYRLHPLVQSPTALPSKSRHFSPLCPTDRLRQQITTRCFNALPNGFRPLPGRRQPETSGPKASTTDGDSLGYYAPILRFYQGKHLASAGQLTPPTGDSVSHTGLKLNTCERQFIPHEGRASVICIAS